ncbi:MAG: glycoside hydrolase family 3 C-terminal domain-containing protein, partial [Duncaniella sp.]|nr:glycoside hydrolase family 3 C-terminal domain-containing protein [Duncaniella sp.]
MKLIDKVIFAGLLAVSATTVTAETPLYLNDDAPIEERVSDALARMTDEEKVALLHAYGKFASSGVPRLGIPQLMMSDGPHGVRAEINWNDWKYAGWTCDSVTAFPALTALAATWNPELSALYGKSVGEEARYRGKDVLLGPGVNIYRTPLNGRNFEYMGEDPCLASVMVVPYIKELQKNGVAACVKHFALNNQEQWRGEIDVKMSDRALYEIYLPAFKAAVERGGAWSIMGAYNKYDGEHACHNHRLLVDILRGEWGFDGAVITDWGGAHDTDQAALNGLDIEMGSYTNGLTSESKFGYEDYFLADPYLKKLRDGSLPDSTLNAKAANVLRLIFRTSMNRHKPFGSLASPEHYAAAKAIGDEAIVLLKNNGVLPLDTTRSLNILVVGENATRNLNEGGGSSDLKVKDMFTPLASLSARFGNVKYAQGYISGRPRYGKEDLIPQSTLDSLRAEAVALAREADVVIYIG